MAALPEATTLTTANDLVPSGTILPALTENLPPTAFRLVANVVPVKRGSAVIQPTAQALSISSSAKTETDNFAEDSLTTDPSSIPVYYYGLTVPMSREIISDAEEDARQLEIRTSVEKLEDLIEQLGFGLLSSASNTQGAVTDVWTRTKILVAKAAAVALIQPKPGENLVLVAGPTAMLQLETDEVISAATVVPSNLAQNGAPVRGFHGNMAIIETPHVPTSTTGHIAGITVAGKRSGLVMPVRERMTIGYDVSEQRKVIWLTVAIRAGFGIGNQANLLGVLGN